jgi:alpha-glutamyl/putrescinyl thymine pyrophosphorylase clade 1/Thymidylate kinase
MQRSVSPTSLQLLHVAAHIDAIEQRILPALCAGRTVVLDRFWWSTVVEGIVSGLSRQALDAMIELEDIAWGDIQPSALFLIRRHSPLRPEPLDQWRQVRDAYETMVSDQAPRHPVHIIDNDGTVEGTMDVLAKAVKGSSNSPLPRAEDDASKLTLTSQRAKTIARVPYTFSALSPARPSMVFDTYWQFAAARQAVFFKRFVQSPPPWTNDPILQEYKFTNTYRASDRVSQFLVRHVIYEGDPYVST